MITKLYLYQVFLFKLNFVYIRLNNCITVRLNDPFKESSRDFFVYGVTCTGSTANCTSDSSFVWQVGKPLSDYCFATATKM